MWRPVLANLGIVRPGLARELGGGPDWGVVAPVRRELRGDRSTSRAEVAGVARSGRGRVARAGAVVAGKTVGAIGGVSRAGKVVERAVRARLREGRPDGAVTSSCVVCVCCVFARCIIAMNMKVTDAGGINERGER